MSATIAVRVNDDATPVKNKTVCHIDLTGLTAASDTHTFAAGDDGVTSPEELTNEVLATPIVYYLQIDGVAEKAMKSPEFTPSSDGKWTWDDVVFRESGSLNIKLKKRDGTTVATQAVTVAAS